MTCRELRISYYLDEDRVRWNGGGPPPAYPQDEVKQIERLTEGFEEFFLALADVAVEWVRPV